jgi:restriction system protein
MSQTTVAQAIVQVLKKSSQPMSAREIYDAILAEGLYEFKAKDAYGVVRNQLSRHCEGKANGAVSSLKLFQQNEAGNFVLISNDF